MDQLFGRSIELVGDVIELIGMVFVVVDHVLQKSDRFEVLMVMGVGIRATVAAHMSILLSNYLIVLILPHKHRSVTV